jgi:hypothetical protein
MGHVSAWAAPPCGLADVSGRMRTRETIVNKNKLSRHAEVFVSLWQHGPCYVKRPLGSHKGRDLHGMGIEGVGGLEASIKCDAR